MQLPRTGALVASATLVVSGLTLLPTPAHAVPDARPSETASAWLVGELTDGLMHNPNFGGFDDYGLTIDAGLALVAIGEDVAVIRDAIADHVDDYVTGDAFGDTGSLYAGQAAKAAVFAAAAGADPTSFGGRDLAADVESRVSAVANIDGRIEDLSPVFGGDYANVIGQAFAYKALEQAGSSRAGDALDYLLDQQCPGGFFRLYLTPDKGAPDQTCAGGRATGESPADPDATSTAVRMLAEAAETSPAAARALGKAEAWLLGRQNADGSFNGGTSTDVPNANSTGLAGWALGLIGDTEAAARAAVWVRSQQADEVAGCANALTGETGAVGYDPAAVTAGLTGGITDANADQWRRSTAQGLPALQYLDAVTPDLEATGPSGYVRAGRNTLVRVAGATPGEKLCVTGIGPARRGVAGADGAATVTVKVPAGTAVRVGTVANRDGGSAAVQVRALGSTRFSVRLSRTTARRGTVVKVRATGLAPGEKARLVFRGVTLRSGRANANGVYATEFNVRRKLGRANVNVFGQFVGRRGIAVIRVVR